MTILEVKLCCAVDNFQSLEKKTKIVIKFLTIENIFKPTLEIPN